MKILSSYVSPRGPFSAVRPDHYSQPPSPQSSAPVDEVDASFGEGHSEVDDDSGLSTEEMKREGTRSAVAALAAFPQVVHLLTDVELPYGENLAAEVDLPLVSLGEPGSEDLGALLSQPKYEDGFILEGVPADIEAAKDLDQLLSATGPEARRVLSWDYNSQSHQEILDHYIDQDLLWMVPPCSDPSDAQQVKRSHMDCLVGLPAVE